MKITIEFATDNAAFADAFEAQLHDIFRQTEETFFKNLNDNRRNVVSKVRDINHLHDLNGNTVGKVTVTGK